MSIVSQYLKQIHSGGGNLLDILWCTLRYGASPNNYYEFDFAHLTSAQRRTYVTNRLSRKMIKRFNEPRYELLFEDKTQFAETFAPFFGREWISTKDLTLENFADFLKKVGKQFIFKPVGNAQGQGIKVMTNNGDVESLYKEITQNKQIAILEEWIEQHPVMASVYAEAVNCLRIITVLKNDKVYYLAGGITWGNGKKIANASASGIVSPVDFSTGILTKPAADFHGNVYEKHPISGVRLVGLKIPFWQETVDMLEKAARHVPQIGYVGWDLAITTKGPVLIEGNTTPGYKYYQIPVHLQNKIGNRKQYEELLD